MNRMVSRLCACLVAFSLFAALCGGMVARAADGFAVKALAKTIHDECSVYCRV